MSLQEKMERLYEQRKQPAKRPTISIRGAVVLSTKEVYELNRKSAITVS